MKTRYFLVIATILMVLSACKQDTMLSIHERTEWSHTWMVNTSDTTLPRVLVIGDSHAERYYPHLAYSLNRQANVCKLTTSKSLGDPILSDQVSLILKQHRFDIITFNNGLHGRAYSEAEYGDHLSLLIEAIKKESDASLILVNTTPARIFGNLDKFQDFNDKVIERNQLFKEITKTAGLRLVDFYSLGSGGTEFYTDDGIHFNQEGVKKQAEILSTAIKDLL